VVNVLLGLLKMECKEHHYEDINSYFIGMKQILHHYRCLDCGKCTNVIEEIRN
jgi:hypothetical protein